MSGAPGLYVFMRHGEAVSRLEAGSDEERWLTERGRRCVEAAARLLPLRPRVVYSSPLRRARETAEIVASAAGARLVVAGELAPGTASCEALERLAPEPGSVLVGHAPSIEAVAACVAGGGQLRIEPCGFAVVEAEELGWGAGRLVELVQPRLILLSGSGRA